MGMADLSSAKRCYQCEANNPAEQGFCGKCGAPLSFDDYISKKVKEQLASVVRDRDVVETDLAIKVLDRAWGYVKKIAAVAAVPVAILGGTIAWKFADWRLTVDKAQQAVVEASKTSREQIEHSSSLSLQEITKASVAAKESIEKLRREMLQTKTEVAREAASVKTEAEDSRSQLESARKLQPEMIAMQQRLERASSDIQAQQKVLSSSDEFIKEIFSSHVVEFFNAGQSPEDRFVIVPPPKGRDRTTGQGLFGSTVVFFLLKATPITPTLQLRCHIFTEPENSYVNVHNLVMFFWGDPPDMLKTKPISISYFPDKTDRELIRSLSERDGRVFADNEPLPKLNQPDPDFKGSKFVKISNK